MPLRVDAAGWVCWSCRSVVLNPSKSSAAGRWRTSHRDSPATCRCAPETWQSVKLFRTAFKFSNFANGWLSVSCQSSCLLRRAASFRGAACEQTSCPRTSHRKASDISSQSSGFRRVPTSCRCRSGLGARCSHSSSSPSATTSPGRTAAHSTLCPSRPPRLRQQKPQKLSYRCDGGDRNLQRCVAAAD